MDRYSTAAVALIVLSALVGASPVIVEKTSIKTGKASFNTSINVTENRKNISLGIAPGDNLHYGEVPVDTNITKYVVVNSGNKTVMMDIHVEGNISGILDYRDRIFFTGQRKVSVEAQPGGTGYYAGKFVLKAYIPRDDLGRLWVDYQKWMKENF